jgi:hypothetical protein
VTQKKNIDQYIALLRENVRQQRVQITGAVLQLTPEESKKFWPIYAQNQQRVTIPAGTQFWFELRITSIPGAAGPDVEVTSPCGL